MYLLALQIIEKRKKKRQFFITNSAYNCIEINAHQLTYLTLLVSEKKLPPEALNIYLFSSQTCEGMFHTARAMSGTFSSIVNFSIQEFLNRAQKLSLLHAIKTESEFDPTNTTLIFPKHYKQRNEVKQSVTIIPNNDTLNVETITKVACEAFNDAADLLFRFNIKKFLYE